MTDGVNPSMNAMQTLCRHAAGSAPTVDPDLLQLRQRNDSVLIQCEASDGRITAGAVTFCTHVGA
jgi:hypothetical protein